MKKSHLDMALADLEALVEEWSEEKRSPTGSLNTNVMTVGLIVSTRLGERFPIESASIRTQKGQVRGLSGTTVSKLLRRFGEDRPFTSEGGRTSRGSVDLALELTDLINNHHSASAIRTINNADREFIASGLQEWFVRLIQADYFDKKRISPDLDASRPMQQAIATVLSTAAERRGNTAGAVAQHLVGANLSLRFPDIVIGNDGYTTADQQTLRAGDFQIQDTVFHVTMSPSEKLIKDRCRDNVKNHYRPIVLVPESLVVGARQIAQTADTLSDISIISIETFIGLNVEELAIFSGSQAKNELRRLLEKYNERVNEAEPDPSLQIEIPANL